MLLFVKITLSTYIKASRIIVISDEEFHNPKITFFESYDDVSQNTYVNICKQLKVTPVSYILRNLTESEIVMKNHVLGAKGAKACAIALMVRNYIWLLTY